MIVLPSGQVGPVERIAAEACREVARAASALAIHKLDIVDASVRPEGLLDALRSALPPAAEREGLRVFCRSGRVVG